MSKFFTKVGFVMKVSLIESVVYDEQNVAHKTFGVRVLNKCYYDLSLNKKLVERFVEFLNKDEAPDAKIEVVIEDFLSGNGL